QKNRHDQRASRASGSAGRARNLDGISDFTAHNDYRFSREDLLRKCLHTIARVHRFGRSSFLSVAGWRCHCFAKQISPGRAPVSDLGLSDRPAHPALARRIVACRSCLARAGHLGNRNRDRAHRFAGLSFLAQKRRELRQIRFRFHERNICMPARSKKQQMAAGAALAAKRGKRSKKSLKGASGQMAKSMSESELRKFAKTKRKKLPTKKRKRRR